MNQLKPFLAMLCGHFNNAVQLEKFKTEGISNYPFAEHINTLCNDKILDLPHNFKGGFVLEESYYTINQSISKMPYLFLITEESEGIRLVSYEMPEGYTKDNFTYENLKPLSYQDLKINEKFTPILYRMKDGSFYGKSVSMFSPVTRFTLEETLTEKLLLVSETIEVNGKRTFGYNLPIAFRRCE